MSLNPKSKGMKTVTSKTQDVKRAATSAEVSGPRKRLRSKRDILMKSASPPVEYSGPDPNYIRKGVFRFLDLPGEIRNQIYAYTIEYAHRCFPPTWPKYVSFLYGSHYPPPRTRTKLEMISHPLPYLPLTQICTTIRQEFRPLWLSTNRFPFFALEGYLKAFYPATPRKFSAEAKARFEKSFDPAGALRVSVGKDRIPSIDILQLLKLKLRFPEFTITPVLFPQIKDEATIAALTLLFNNSTAKWVKWIESRKIRQVRVEMMYSTYPGGVHVVIGEKWAEPWMRVVSPSNQVAPQARRMREEMGLGDLEWNVTFGVDYS